jgi:hypothetical protein
MGAHAIGIAWAIRNNLALHHRGALLCKMHHQILTTHTQPNAVRADTTQVHAQLCSNEKGSFVSNNSACIALA